MDDQIGYNRARLGTEVPDWVQIDQIGYIADVSIDQIGYMIYHTGYTDDQTGQVAQVEAAGGRSLSGLSHREVTANTTGMVTLGEGDFHLTTPDTLESKWRKCG